MPDPWPLIGRQQEVAFVPGPIRARGGIANGGAAGVALRDASLEPIIASRPAVEPEAVPALLAVAQQKLRGWPLAETEPSAGD